MKADIDAALPYTMTGRVRLAAMAAALERIDREGIKGDIVECGVWRGGNIILARRLSPARRCWLYDTFEGMTEPGPEDISRGGLVGKAGTCKASRADVLANLIETGTFDEDKIVVVEGDVKQTLGRLGKIPERIALLRLDTDWMVSTKLELEVLYPRLAPGGILIVDDYGHWKGARKAVDEYFGSNGPPMERIDYTAIQIVKA